MAVTSGCGTNMHIVKCQVVKEFVRQLDPDALNVQGKHTAFILCTILSIVLATQHVRLTGW